MSQVWIWKNSAYFFQIPTTKTSRTRIIHKNETTCSSSSPVREEYETKIMLSDHPMYVQKFVASTLSKLYVRKEMSLK